MRNGVSLIGKSFIRPKDFSVDEIKSLLWTAIDLRRAHETGNLSRDLLKHKRVVYLSSKQTVQSVALASGAHLTGASYNHMVVPSWDYKHNLEHLGKIMNDNVDMFLCQCKRFKVLEEMIPKNRAAIPMVLVKCCKFSTPQALIDLMTIQMKSGKLAGLNISWIGPTCSKINSYLCIYSRLGMNIKYCCNVAPDLPMSPIGLPNASTSTCQVEEFRNFREGLKGTDVIVIKSYKYGDFQLHSEDVALANKDWILIQQFPIKREQIEDSMNDRNMIWESVKNAKYIYAALMIRLLKNYTHNVEKPISKILLTPLIGFVNDDFQTGKAYVRANFEYVRANFEYVRANFENVRVNIEYVRANFEYVRVNLEYVRANFEYVRANLEYVRANL
ncbi:PREDICTED: ornithine carbamoyltransferase, mitochondrial-like, partial [Nicrophorus vespilloides]|uniref:ornithine carbamoyltransferase n=1 Tax=Nicrophorus vespilloides TaxID=110193 RepID=A0ABM1MWY0_NICVS